jgi:hypothetical protein
VNAYQLIIAYCEALLLETHKALIHPIYNPLHTKESSRVDGFVQIDIPAIITTFTLSVRRNSTLTV